jgi:D-alanine transfer protein
MQTALLALQDHFAALIHIKRELEPAPPNHSEIVDWPKLIAKIDDVTTDGADNSKQSSSSDGQTISDRDIAFRNDMNAAPAWIDLELLLRTLAEVHARPLLLSMPIAGQLYDQTGVSRSTRDLYYTKLRAMVQRYNFELIEFKEHDEDPAFLYRQASHLAAKGWIFYNRALDDFFHGRIPRTWAKDDVPSIRAAALRSCAASCIMTAAFSDKVLQLLASVADTEEVFTNLDLPLYDHQVLDSIRTFQLMVIIDEELGI